MNNYKIITVKCYFSSILNKKSNYYNQYKEVILKSIKDINIITSLLYDFIKLRCLYNFKNHNEPGALVPAKSSLCEDEPIDFYIYTDKEININNIEYIVNINDVVNIAHIHNHIYINDKLFLDYIDIPRYITFQ